MEDLRKPLFVIACALCVLVVLVELGAQALLGGVTASAAEMSAVVDRELSGLEGVEDADRAELARELRELNRGADPPGLAIGYLALLDGLVLFAVGLLAAPLLVPRALHGRLQGVLTLVVSLLALLGSVVLFFAAFVLLLQMVAMFLAAPWGTLAYIALFGFFDRGGASVALSLLMALKLGFAACLIFAHQRFLRNKGLVLIVLTSLLANVVVSFLHGFVPLVLVSITDALAAIVICILALVWALALLIGSIPSIKKAVA